MYLISEREGINMKGVIVEIRGDIAAMLSDDGCIVKVKNKKYEIGQEVEINMKKSFNFKKFAAVAAACLMLVLGGGGALAYYTPAKYVSLDVNPSIEYQLNIFDRVLTVKGVNDDGSEIVDEIDLGNLKNKKIDEAIALTVDKIAENGYLDSEEGGIVITTSSKNSKRAKELAETLENIVNEVCKENNCVATVNAEAVGAERVAKAKELGVTPGKLNLVEKLIESSEDHDSVYLNEWLNKSVKDIMAQIKQNKQQNKEQNKEQEQNSNENIKNKEQNQNEESNGKTDVNTDDGTANSGKGSGKSDVSVSNGATTGKKGNSNIP